MITSVIGIVFLFLLIMLGLPIAFALFVIGFAGMW